MGTRISHETIYVRHDYTDTERLLMGSELAQSYSNLEIVEGEFKNVQAQFKERLSGVNTRIGSLSRQLGSGFEMCNVRCELKWDTPNVGEVSYVGPDGKVEKVRAMAPSEQQLELELAAGEAPAPTPEQEIAAVAESQENIATFFEEPEPASNAPSAEDLDAVAGEQALADPSGTPDDEDVFRF